MKRNMIFAAVASLVSFVGMASAGGLNEGLADPVILAPTAEVSYLAEGLYFGGTLGTSFEGTTHDVANSAAVEKSLTGERVGVQVGYDWAVRDRLFVGLEGDLQLNNVGNDWQGYHTNQYNAYYTEDKVNQSLAIKAKAGLTDEKWAVYGFVGGVVAKTENALGCDRALVTVTNGCQPAFNTSAKSTSTGYTVGVGGEYKVGEHLSVKAEYSYIDLGKTNVDLVDPNYPSAVTGRSFDTKYSTINVGVNFRF